MSSAIEKFQAWYRDKALPLWISNGYDHANGGFFETLDFNAAPIIGQPRRVRVQARQIYSFAKAAANNGTPGAKDLALKGFDYLLENACPDDGARGCVHTLDDKGGIIDAKRDLYDQAFCLLACAAIWEAFGDDRAIELATRVKQFLSSELASSHGGWFESDKQETPRRQNPHMHLLEASTALFRVTGDNEWRRMADTIAMDLFSIFMNFDDGVLHEYFHNDLSTDLSQPDIEPGHMLEWVTLLHAYEDISGTDTSESRALLFSRAKELGPNPQFFGFLKNEVQINSPFKPSAMRLWPQTEYLKAACIEASDGNEHARDIINPLIEGLFATYLNTETEGLWVDEFDTDGAPIAKDVPASILYHLFEAVAQTEKYEKEFE